MRYLASATVLIALASPALAADRISGTWTTGGPSPQTFVFKASGDRFAGIACGPCDRPASVFRVEDGRILDGERVSFLVLYDTDGPRFKEFGKYRDRFEGSFRDGQLSLSVRAEGRNVPASTVTLKRVVEGFVPDTTNVPPSSLLEPDSGGPPADIEGRWVFAFKPQQNLILKVRGQKVWGVICGPCTPEVVAMIDDGTFYGNTVRFHINHFDTNRFPQPERGVQRNIMTGTVVDNVINFRWVREQAQSDTGEMVFIGPVRE